MSDEPNPIASSVPSLVLFDLDDTLCDHDSSLRLRLRLAFEAAADGLGQVDISALVDVAAARSVGGTGHFAELLEQFGVEDPSRHDVAINHYVSDRYRGLELFDDALQIVHLIKQYAHVGLITNGPSQIQRDKIERLAISNLFEVILVSEEEGIWKPDPLIFARALARFDVTPDEAIYVGDSPEHDVAGARAAGVTSVWINRRGRVWPGGVRADFEISDLTELPSLLGITDATVTSNSK
jgi:2-haloalkanoic acid dehalogenase type II